MIQSQITSFAPGGVPRRLVIWTSTIVADGCDPWWCSATVIGLSALAAVCQGTLAKAK
jgi:hypothetical protein